MTAHVVYITAHTLYAIKLDRENEYYQMAWDPTNLDTGISDVISTLGTKSLHVILGVDLPPLDQSISYQSFLVQNGVIIQDVTTSADLALKYISSSGVGHADIYLSKYEQALIHIRAGRVAEAKLVTDKPNISGLWIYVDGGALNDHSRPLPDLPEYFAASEMTKISPSLSLNLGSLEDLGVRKHRINWIIPSVIVLAITLAISIYLLKPPTTRTQVVVSPTPTATPSPTPTPSPVVPSPSNSEFSVQIQNGSGIAGLAGKVSAKLEGEGFVVKDVGNADNFNYKQGVLKTRPTVPASVVTSITKLFGTSSWDKEALPSTSNYDIVIIIGEDTALSN